MVKTNSHYLTISDFSEGIYKEKGSKFLAFAFPISNETQIKAHIQSLKKQYHDARHHCFAYILGANSEKYRANDDGEPNNSAGMPILGQIKSNNLTNVLVVVVRYFGGTKLGISGLIQAYKIATADALSHTSIIEKMVTQKIKVFCPYPKLNEVMRLFKSFEVEITEQTQTLECTFEVEVVINLVENFTKSLDLAQIQWKI